METEELVDQIMSAVYHAAILHPDPVVQERIVKSDLWNILEDFGQSLAAEVENDDIAKLEDQLSELQAEHTSVLVELSVAEDQIELLKERLVMNQ